jgi:hypothetical protein
MFEQVVFDDDIAKNCDRNLLSQMRTNHLKKLFEFFLFVVCSLGFDKEGAN